jgi:hypothetical protein
MPALGQKPEMLPEKQTKAKRAGRYGSSGRSWVLSETLEMLIFNHKDNRNKVFQTKCYK